MNAAPENCNQMTTEPSGGKPLKPTDEQVVVYALQLRMTILPPALSDRRCGSGASPT